MSSYLAFQSMQSYGPCLQASADAEDELFDLTDGFSVAALKVRPHALSLNSLHSGDKNISILHLSCRTSDLQFSLVLQTHALVL